MNKDKQIAMLTARIDRLEELIVAMYDRHECKSLARQIDAELYERTRSSWTLLASHPVPLEERVQKLLKDSSSPPP